MRSDILDLLLFHSKQFQFAPRNHSPPGHTLNYGKDLKESLTYWRLLHLQYFNTTVLKMHLRKIICCSNFPQIGKFFKRLPTKWSVATGFRVIADSQCMTVPQSKLGQSILIPKISQFLT